MACRSVRSVAMIGNRSAYRSESWTRIHASVILNYSLRITQTDRRNPVWMPVGMVVGIIPTPSSNWQRAKRPVKRGLMSNWCAHRSPVLPPAWGHFLLSALRYRSGMIVSRDVHQNAPKPALSPLTRPAAGLGSADRSGRPVGDNN